MGIEIILFLWSWVVRRGSWVVRRASVIRKTNLKPNYTMNCQNFARIFLAATSLLTMATLTKRLVDSLNLWVVEFNYSNLTCKRHR